MNTLRLGPMLPTATIPIGTSAVMATYVPDVVRRRERLESALVRMVTLCGSADLVHLATTEVQRRKEVMDEIDAIESVSADVAAGRLRGDFG